MDVSNRGRVYTTLQFCDRCNMLVSNCICNKAKKFKSEAEIWILTVEKELYRSSNTAKLLKLVNPL